jgi:two-component system chemotaxis response regulator CheY
VLVVDDVPLIRAVLCATLEQVGLTDVHEAGDGAAAQISVSGSKLT